MKLVRPGGRKPYVSVVSMFSRLSGSGNREILWERVCLIFPKYLEEKTVDSWCTWRVVGFFFFVTPLTVSIVVPTSSVVETADDACGLSSWTAIVTTSTVVETADDVCCLSSWITATRSESNRLSKHWSVDQGNLFQDDLTEYSPVVN